MAYKGKPVGKQDGTALTAVALQDHLVRSLALGSSPLSGQPSRRKLDTATRYRPPRNVKSTIDTGRGRKPKAAASKTEEEREIVLDEPPPAPTLAQKLGLFPGPPQHLTENEWSAVKSQSSKRDDSKQPCVICKDDFGTGQQVLLSCSHVFHRACLEAFERFSGKKSCPMCRREHYQTRVIYDGQREHRIQCATVIQSYWRGHVVRKWYRQLRELYPPKDPRVRKKFYTEKLAQITDRIVRSCDFDVNAFLSDIDRSVEQSREIFKLWDCRQRQISEADWQEIMLKAVTRCDTDCPICLTSLVRKRKLAVKSDTKVAKKQQASQGRSGLLPRGKGPERKSGMPKAVQQSQSSTVTHGNSSGETMGDDAQKPQEKTPIDVMLLSCSHVFHTTCLGAFEELAVGVRQMSCPVCRAAYQKNVVAWPVD